jgi:tRNA U34 5-methylaminomethyl-2-thiouridine-forming methyltransferase MnmC
MTVSVDKAGTEIYHSTHGALQESRYVFIQQGLDLFLESTNSPNAISILEVGFGTGLNASLAYCWAAQHGQSVSYTGLEPYPIEPELATSLGYEKLLGIDTSTFLDLHSFQSVKAPLFSGQVFKTTLEAYQGQPESFNLCWFDAFSPRYQPELWTEAIFAKVVLLLAPGGYLVTYSAKGEVKRNLIAAGFDLEKLPGPPGKREMLRARKPL